MSNGRRPIGERLWICGQRKRVAHIPTAGSNSRQLQFDDLTKAAFTRGFPHPSVSRSARGCINADHSAIFTRILTAIHIVHCASVYL
jgi:hypothetical protein